ncbi:MAG: PDZ domain-containing protein [Acidobacteria bacterium]|nr:PDZ domain-containing protein [Acidobacteriota bacterium]
MPPENRRYIVTLAVAAAAILVLGALLRPAPVADEPLPPPPSQAELSRLTRITQRRSLEAMKDYFSAVATDADRSVVRLRMLGRSGVVWAPGLVVTARLEQRFPPTTTVTGDEGELGVPLAAGAPHLPVALLDVPETGEFIPVRRRPIENLDPGAWTVFVTDRHGAGFSPATYVEIAEVVCEGRVVRDVVTSVALGPEMAGAGLFDLDNNLLAVVLPCGPRFVAVTAEDVAALAEEAATVRSRIAQRYGMTLDAVTSEESGHLGVPFGLFVRDVWTGELADTMGLRPGDVVISINAELILDVDQLSPLIDDSARRAAASAAGQGDEVESEDAAAGETPDDPAITDTASAEATSADEASGDETSGDATSADEASEGEASAADGSGDGSGDAAQGVFELGVVRDGETLVLNLPIDPLAFIGPDAPAPDGGLVWDDPGRGYRLDDVRPGTPAARAGLRAGDRLLRIDGAAPDTLDAVRDALSTDRDAPVLLELERGTRRTAVLLP